MEKEPKLKIETKNIEEQKEELEKEAEKETMEEIIENIEHTAGLLAQKEQTASILKRYNLLSDTDTEKQVKELQKQMEELKSKKANKWFEEQRKKDPDFGFSK